MFGVFVFWCMVVFAAWLFTYDFVEDMLKIYREGYAVIPQNQKKEERRSAFKPWSDEKKKAMEVLYDCFDPDTGDPDPTRKEEIDKYYPIAYQREFEWKDYE